MSTKKSDFTQRSLMALVAEMVEHRERGRRIEMMIEVLAKEHGVKIPCE